MANLVCGRWSKWIVVALWLGVLAVAGPLAGKLTGVQENDNSAWLPGSAESTQVLDLQARFQSDDVAPAVIVYERRSGRHRQGHRGRRRPRAGRGRHRAGSRPRPGARR
jgi:RND superfamily putative drug exporter